LVYPLVRGSSKQLDYATAAGTALSFQLDSLKDYPPRQKPQSFNLDQIMEATAAV
jgi:hypothetical protein